MPGPAIPAVQKIGIIHGPAEYCIRPSARLADETIIKPDGVSSRETYRCVDGRSNQSKPGLGGFLSAGPIYAQSTSPASTTGYAWSFTLALKVSPSGTLGKSTQSPCTSNFQPWYTHRSPHSSLRP